MVSLPTGALEGKTSRSLNHFFVSCFALCVLIWEFYHELPGARNNFSPEGQVTRASCAKQLERIEGSKIRNVDFSAALLMGFSSHP